MTATGLLSSIAANPHAARHAQKAAADLNYADPI
jgi:hypothetical protein